MERLEDYLTIEGWKTDLRKTKDNAKNFGSALLLTTFLASSYGQIGHAIAQSSGFYDKLGDVTYKASSLIKDELKKAEKIPSCGIIMY